MPQTDMPKARVINNPNRTQTVAFEGAVGPGFPYLTLHLSEDVGVAGQKGGTVVVFYKDIVKSPKGISVQRAYVIPGIKTSEELAQGKRYVVRPGAEYLMQINEALRDAASRRQEQQESAKAPPIDDSGPETDRPYHPEYH